MVLDSYGGSLCPILVQVIPEHVVLEFRWKNDAGQEWKVSELDAFLQQEDGTCNAVS